MGEHEGSFAHQQAIVSVSFACLLDTQQPSKRAKCEEAGKDTRVHQESVARIGPPMQILILSIGIHTPNCESTVGLVSCSHSQDKGVWRIPSRLVIRVNILLVRERNLQQVATQTGRGGYCI